MRFDDVGGLTLLRSLDLLAGLLLFEQVFDRVFSLIFELLWIQLAGLCLNDVGL
jgi:hypothetical protein